VTKIAPWTIITGRSVASYLYMDFITTFLTGMVGSSPIEIIAFFLGLANVGLLMRRSIWNYPFGIAVVMLYAFIFYEAKLYSDMILQGFFVTIQVYGWWYWLNGNMAEDGHVIVRRLPPGYTLWYGCAAVIGVLALGTFMDSMTDAALPYPDATTTVLSVIAQILLARRYLENWLVWIVVDVLAIGIYFVKGLYPTTVLYVIFLGMAIGGYLLWRRTWLSSQPERAHSS
jgi:nicotinamide mononucleotide transporter